MKKLKIIWMILDAAIMIGCFAWATTTLTPDGDFTEAAIIIGAGFVVTTALSICMVIISKKHND